MKCSLRAVRNVFFLLCLTIAMVACGRFAGRVSLESEQLPVLPASTAPVPVDRVDLFGNQVDAAVNDYRVDPRGDLYERHAPDTEVLKLGSPEI
jgi:hypothetical protein